MADNYMKMDDKCFMYLEAARKFDYTGDSAFFYLNKLISRGEDISDERAVTIGYNSMIKYYSKMNDPEGVESAAKTAREKAKQYNRSMQFFNAYNAEIQYLLEHDRFVAALDKIKAMDADALELDDPQGRFLVNRTLAQLYRQRGVDELAKVYYKRALDINVKYLPTTASSVSFLNLSEIYPLTSDSCILYQSMAEDHLITPNDSIQTYSSRALVSALLGDRDSYDRYLAKYNSTTASKDLDDYTSGHTKYAMARDIMSKDYESAMQLAYSLGDSLTSYNYRLAIVRKMGDKTKELELVEGLMNYRQKLTERASTMDLAEISARFDLDKARKEAQLSADRAARLRNMLIIFAIAALLIAAFTYLTYMIRSRGNRIKEKELLAENLRQANEIKTSFVQNMSHEIRTPLNAVVGFAQILALPDGFNTPEEKEQYAGYINNSSALLTMLIDDILDLSDMEHGNYRVEFGETQCNLVCQVAIKTVEFRTPPEVNMYFTSEVDDSFTIVSDPRRVQQVIINYLTNSCKHTEKGEIHVHVSDSEVPGKVTFSVTDTGCGVPAEKAESIFERFTKLDSFTQGSGLGLSICRLIADKLGGEVKLDTSYTGGARFLFILPLDGTSQS